MVKLNEYIFNIGKEVSNLSEEEYSKKMTELLTTRKDCCELGIPTPIEVEFEILYLETGNKVLKLLNK